MTTTVTNLKGRQAELGPTLDNAEANLVYVGRPTYRGGWRIPGSPLFNPYAVGVQRTRAQAVTQYGQHLLQHPEHLALLPDLRGHQLACWCAPDLCHGHLLAHLAEQDQPETALKTWLDSGEGGAALIHGTPDAVQYLYEKYDPHRDEPFQGYAVRRYRILRMTPRRIYYAKHELCSRCGADPSDLQPVVGYLDRQKIESAGEIWDGRRRLYLKPPELAKPLEQPTLTELKQQMADSHPDRGGSDEAFISARAEYQRARTRQTQTTRSN